MRYFELFGPRIILFSASAKQHFSSLGRLLCAGFEFLYNSSEPFEPI